MPRDSLLIAAVVCFVPPDLPFAVTLPLAILSFAAFEALCWWAGHSPETA